MIPAESLQWLYSAQQFGIKLGLENTRRLLAALDHPERKCRFLHVAGTNGKGSTCAIAESILRAHGLRTGLYTSPHLIRFTERIRVSGVEIPEPALARILTRLRDITEPWEHRPTFFELATVLAIRHFADEKTDIVVLETGMGGRLDSTNAITALATVITPIARDHAQWLGETLPEIAAEKAGILKSGIPCVSAGQTPEIRAVLESRAAEVECPLEFITTSQLDTPLALTGGHQRRNAALAIAAVRAARITASDHSIARGLASVSWPGRFQQLGNFILDGAHNEHGARQLVETWRATFDREKPLILFSALADKAYARVLEILEPIASEFFFVPVHSARGADPEKLAQTTSLPHRIFPDFRSALDAAGTRRTLITGSLFLVGEALEAIAASSPIPASAGN
jgi:dihydrofolate synthase/folylpolyglutamate synthase